MVVKNKKKRKRKVNKYEPEIEAAYYVLNPFVSSVDFVVRYIDKHGNKQIATENPNCVIVANMSGYHLLKPSRVTKEDYVRHFERNTILFYKSPPNSPYFTGYGGYDSTAQKLPFSAELEVFTKKQVDEDNYVLLVGIDLDCHNGENHVYEVMALIKKYLPNTYWEQSTNGNGLHGYIKIKYKNSFGVIKQISSDFKKLFDLLRQLKDLYGYEAILDEPAGLPYKYESVKTNPYQENWTSLHYKVKNKETNKYENKFLGNHINRKDDLWQGYIDYLENDTTYYLPKKCRKEPAILTNYLTEDKIKNTFSDFLQKNNITFPPPTKNKKYHKITVQRAFKVPLFGADPTQDGSSFPKMDCIKEFYFLPYYTSSEIKEVKKQISEDIKQRQIDSNLPIDTNNIHRNISDQEVNQYKQKQIEQEHELAYTMPIPHKGGKQCASTRSFHSLVPAPHNDPVENSQRIISSEYIQQKEKQEKESNNCAYTNTLFLAQKSTLAKKESSKAEKIYIQQVKWTEIASNEFDVADFWKEYKKNRKSNPKKYTDEIAELKSENDTMKKSRMLALAYIHKIGRIPTPEETQDEYVAQGLNSSPEPDKDSRIRRFKSILNYLEADYDESITKFTLNWQEERNNVIKKIKPHLPKQLKYKQGERTKSYTAEDVALVYYIIQRMDEEDQHQILGNSLSYKHVDKLFLQVLGKTCGRNKFSCIKKVLLDKKRIKKTKNHRAGLRGICYGIIPD